MSWVQWIGVLVGVYLAVGLIGMGIMLLRGIRDRIRGFDDDSSPMPSAIDRKPRSLVLDVLGVIAGYLVVWTLWPLFARDMFHWDLPPKNSVFDESSDEEAVETGPPPRVLRQPPPEPHADPAVKH